MPRDGQIKLPDGAAPVTYMVPNAAEIIPKAINATFDGTAASGSFVPAVELVSDGGVVVARVPCQTTVAAGDSAECTFAPFLRADQTASAGGTGAWGLVYRSTLLGDPGLSVPNSVPTAVPFLHFETTDTAVFTTSPNDASGDTILKCHAAGVYTFEMGAQWSTTFSQVTRAFISVQTFHGPSWAHRANWLPYTAPGAFGATFQMFDARVYPFTDSDLSGGAASVEIDVAQASGVSQTLTQMWLRVAYLPTSGAETVVY